MHHLIYLTGAPATGKSSLCVELKERIGGLIVFSYAEELRKCVASRVELTHDHIRAKSASVISRDDVQKTDAKLRELVLAERVNRHIIVDSHPITKEDFGFRATPFSTKVLKAVRPTIIFCLYADTEVVRQRIANNPGGRPQVTPFESDFHIHLQASVAFTYGMILDTPVYYLDSNREIALVAEEVIKRISR